MIPSDGQWFGCKGGAEMQATVIEWTDFSANPLKYRDKASGKTVWACVKHSPGCAHCYAEAIALRYGRGGPFTKSGMEKVEPFLDEKELGQLLKSRKLAGKRCFVGDMTDVFGEWVPDEILDRLFAVFALRPDVTFQMLTKRADRMREYLTVPGRHNSLELAADAIQPGKGHPSFGGKHLLPSLPLLNVWCGVSVENQDAADKRIPLLLQTPAAVRFLSCEPLLGPIDISEIPIRSDNGELEGAHTNPLTGETIINSTGYYDQPQIHWVIVGGESGPGARPCRVEWIRSIVGQCKAAGVACFVKQDSGPKSGMQGRIPLDIWHVKEFPNGN